MASSSSHGDTAEIEEVSTYFGSKAYYNGELLKAGQELRRQLDEEKKASQKVDLVIPSVATPQDAEAAAAAKCWALRGESGKTPLDWARQGGFNDVAEILVTAGAAAEADAEAARKCHDNIFYAARLGNLPAAAVVRLLLEHRASLEARNIAGQTPLDWARERGHTEVVQILENAAQRR
eukprot:Skav210120  [mRNA]  locus=scaffold2194:171369:178956:+ [translate_table: standard]